MRTIENEMKNIERIYIYIFSIEIHIYLLNKYIFIYK